MNPTLLTHYLNLLGVSKREPSAEALAELVEAQMLRVPFENISKVYYKKISGLCHLPDLAFHLDGIKRFNFGGTCYANNFYFYQLLAALGYQIRLCGADMANPDVHLVSIVTVANREYLVDVGYAAPFLAPLPRDLTRDYVVTLGRDRYILKPQDEQGRSQLQLYRNGELKHGYQVNPAPRQIEEFGEVIADSYRDTATFMNALLLARFFPNRSLVIHNLSLIESQGGESKVHSLVSWDELAQVIERHFAIPPAFTQAAAAELEQLQDAWD